MPGPWVRGKVLDAGSYGPCAAHPAGFAAPGAGQPVGKAGAAWLDMARLAAVVPENGP